MRLDMHHMREAFSSIICLKKEVNPPFAICSVLRRLVPQEVGHNGNNEPNQTECNATVNEIGENHQNNAT